MPKASERVSESAWKQDGSLLKQKARLACGSRSASLAEVEQKAKGQAKLAAGVAHASACVGMASCIPAYEPVVVQLDTMADQWKARKACRVHPWRHRVAV